MVSQSAPPYTEVSKYTFGKRLHFRRQIEKSSKTNMNFMYLNSALLPASFAPTQPN